VIVSQTSYVSFPTGAFCAIFGHKELKVRLHQRFCCCCCCCCCCCYCCCRCNVCVCRFIQLVLTNSTPQKPAKNTPLDQWHVRSSTKQEGEPSSTWLHGQGSEGPPGLLIYRKCICIPICMLEWNTASSGFVQKPMKPEELCQWSSPGCSRETCHMVFCPPGRHKAMC